MSSRRVGKETVFKLRVLRDLDTLPKSVIIKVQQLSRIGDPDIICVINSHYVAIELKATEKSYISQKQILTLHQISKAGGFSFVAHPDNWDRVFSFVKMLSELPITYREIDDPCLKLPSFGSETLYSKMP